MGLQWGYNGTIMRLGDGISAAKDRKEKPVIQDGPPPVISWFLNHYNPH